jgi:single-stranded DNA-binding protein
MSENIWIGGGTAHYVKFNATAKGGLYVKFSLGVYDSYTKTTDFINVVCFDDYTCNKLQAVLKDKDYIRVEGRLKVEYKKEEKTTYVQIIANRIVVLGNVRFEDIPTFDHKVNVGVAPTQTTTNKEVVDAIEEDSVPF